MTVITAVKDEPVVIQSIDPGRKVDDDIDEDVSTLVREWNVITNDTKTELTIYDVFDAEPRFLPGTVFDHLKVNNVRLKQTESNCIYRLEAEFVRYEHKTPFFVPIDWEWETSVLEIPAYADYKGRPCVTTAGEPIAGLTRRLKLWVIRGTRNVPGVPSWFRDYGVSVNSDRVTIDGERFKENELQLQRLSLGTWDSTVIGKREYRFRPVSFEFWFNPLTWTSEVLNLGFNELVIREVEVAGQKVKRLFQVRATNADGDETKNRVFLNKEGQRPRELNGDIKTTLKPKDIITLKFDLDDRLPYMPLLK